MKPPIKRFTEGITYYSYGGPNATGESYKNISDDQDVDTDVVSTDEQQINGYSVNDHEAADEEKELDEIQGEGKYHENEIIQSPHVKILMIHTLDIRTVTEAKFS